MNGSGHFDYICVNNSSYGSSAVEKVLEVRE